MNKNKKGGYITTVEKKSINSKARELLEQVKNNELEKSKIPFRVGDGTIYMVTKKRYKELEREYSKG